MPEPKSVRLNKADYKNITAIKALMRKASIPNNLITLSSAIQWALAQMAQMAKKAGKR